MSDITEAAKGRTAATGTAKKSEPILSVRGLRKSFGNVTVLDGIDIDVQPGEVLSLIGPSGAGKTTFLRTLNWLERPDAGTISIDGATVDAAGKGPNKGEVSALRSKTAMVFQRYALFRNKTAIENVTLALRCVKRMPDEEARELGLSLLDRCGLRDQADRYPSQLSGGQEQRVGIARAFPSTPRLCCSTSPQAPSTPSGWARSSPSCATLRRRA